MWRGNETEEGYVRSVWSKVLLILTRRMITHHNPQLLSTYTPPLNMSVLLIRRNSLGEHISSTMSKNGTA